MSTETLAAPSPVRTRRPVAKSTARREVKPIKTAVSLPAETMRRLAITAVMSGRSQSEVVAELIDLHCRRYVVADRGGEASADRATLEVSAAA